MNHFTVAVAEATFRQLLEAARDGFTFSSSNSGNFGPFSASYVVALHLEDGTIDLRNDSRVKIGELDIKWDTLMVGVGFDIPEMCVGGWCVIPNPFDGCLVLCYS